MTTQISQTGRIDLDTADVRGPVINYPGGDHFVEVKITSHLSLLITTAAEAQELETRFAAARIYLSDEPLLVPDVAQPADLPDPACCDADWGSAMASQRCVRNDGHGGAHVDGDGREFGPARADIMSSQSGQGRAKSSPGYDAQPADLPNPLACGRCGTADHVMDPVTDSRVPGGVKNECHDLHDCGERAAVAHG